MVRVQTTHFSAKISRHILGSAPGPGRIGRAPRLRLLFNTHPLPTFLRGRNCRGRRLELWGPRFSWISTSTLQARIHPTDEPQTTPQRRFWHGGVRLQGAPLMHLAIFQVLVRALNSSTVRLLASLVTVADTIRKTASALGGGV